MPEQLQHDVSGLRRPDLCAGWLLVQHDWSVRQGEPEPARRIARRWLARIERIASRVLRYGAVLSTISPRR